MPKEIVKVTRLNWDACYYSDMVTGIGFPILEPATFNLDEQKQKSLYGARSPFYGTSYEDETAFIERTRCQCGAMVGRLFEGETCPFCNTKCESKDVNMKITGWISLGNNYIINPYGYRQLANAIGKQALADMITTRPIVDVNGCMRPAKPEELDLKSKHPFVAIGLIEFRKRYYEILNYFQSKKKNKDKEFETLKKSATTIFASKIPIYSTFLRPQSSTSDTYYYNTIDKHINPLFSLSEKLKRAEEIDRQYTLDRIQYRVNELWEETFKLLNGKEGWIRGQILGGSFDDNRRN